MTIHIVERGTLQLVGMQIMTRPMSPEIPALWSRFVPRIDEIENALESVVSYGVMWMGESMDILHYMAAISVSKLGRVPEGMCALTLAGGSYASFRHPPPGLAHGLGEIFNRLLPSSVVEQARVRFFERYDGAFDPENPQLVETCMQVIPRA